MYLYNILILAFKAGGWRTDKAVGRAASNPCGEGSRWYYIKAHVSIYMSNANEGSTYLLWTSVVNICWPLATTKWSESNISLNGTPSRIFTREVAHIWVLSEVASHIEHSLPMLSGQQSHKLMSREVRSYAGIAASNARRHEDGHEYDE